MLSLIIVDKETKLLLKMAKDRVEEELGKELTWDEFFKEIVERLGYYDLFDFPKEDLTPDYLGEEEIEEPRDFCCPKVGEDDVRKEVTEDDVLWALKEAEKVMESIYESRNVICSISIDAYPLACLNH